MRRSAALSLFLLFSLSALLLALAGPASSASQEGAAHAAGRDASPYVSADPGAPPVTAQNLLANDRFWPFHVAPVRDWTPPGASAPLPRIPATLIRVDAVRVRLDFGRHGRHELPVEVTDVVERANQVRLGVLEKMAPNLVLTIGNKLLDTRAEQTSNYLVGRDTRLEAFLCVFADVSADGFDGVAEALRRYDGRADLLTVVFPQGELKDSSVRRQLRALDWKVPFVIDRFSKAYRRSIAGEQTALPHVMLLSRDGRVLQRGAFAPELAAGLDAALLTLPLGGQSSQAASPIPSEADPH